MGEAEIKKYQEHWRYCEICGEDLGEYVSNRDDRICGKPECIREVTDCLQQEYEQECEALHYSKFGYLEASGDGKEEV